MPAKPQQSPTNALIQTLSEEQRKRFAAQAERREFVVGAVVVESEMPITHVYLPETAIVSMLCVLPDRSAVETAIVGREGMASVAVFHGVERTPEQAVVQVAGTMLSIESGVFMDFVKEAPRLRVALHRFSQALYTFASQSSACNRMHSVSQRCARWLLATHDRLDADEFPLTHLFLSQMVGVRRSSVTLAAEELRDAGAIAYARGKISIVSRTKLREHSCDCYEIVRATYDRLMEGLFTPHPLDGLDLSEDGKSAVHAGDPSGGHPTRRGQSVEEASHEVLADLGGQRSNSEHAIRTSSPATKYMPPQPTIESATRAVDEALERLRTAQLVLKALR
jgi:CRP-like cAMP-binding protein